MWPKAFFSLSSVRVLGHLFNVHQPFPRRLVTVIWWRYQALDADAAHGPHKDTSLSREIKTFFYISIQKLLLECWLLQILHIWWHSHIAPGLVTLVQMETTWSLDSRFYRDFVPTGTRPRMLRYVITPKQLELISTYAPKQHEMTYLSNDTSLPVYVVLGQRMYIVLRQAVLQ